MKKDDTFKKLILILLVLVFFGVISFLLIGEDLWHAFYVTVIILLSHFKHGTEETISEQVITIILVLGSYLVLAYIIRAAAEYLFGGELKKKRREKKMAKKISKMKDHYIVCGYGRVGKQVAQELEYEKVDFVVVERDPAVAKEAKKKDLIVINGDPIKEPNLIKAGIKRAKALISALGEDTDNLFLTLTARSLNSDIFIVSRASSRENVSKLVKAGANRVSMPYQIGGYHMAGIALRPAVVDFLDVVSDGRHAELQIEEVNVEKGSALIGQKIADSLSREKSGLTVLAINKFNGTTKINPSGEETIERGDQLIIMGTKEQLGNLAKRI